MELRGEVVKTAVGEMVASKVERIMDWKSKYTGFNLGSTTLGWFFNVKCCHWVRSFKFLS